MTETFWFLGYHRVAFVQQTRLQKCDCFAVYFGNRQAYEPEGKISIKSVRGKCKKDLD